MKTKVEAILAASDVIVLLKSLLTDMLMSLDARMTNTVGTKEVVLRGGPPSVDGGHSNRKVNQINSENHQLIVQR